MRIISLLPAATEWIYAFGAGDDLVGRSHACDYPSEAASVPVVTRPTLDTSGDSADLDDEVRRHVREGLSIYEIDVDRLRELAPDVIITQDQCEVCAVSREELEDDVQSLVSERTKLLSMAPLTLKQVMDGALRLGRAIGRFEAAMRVVGEAEKRLYRFMDRLGIDRDEHLAGRSRPSVLCIEWMEPLMAAGHWTPDIVEKAGGTAVLGSAGKPSHYISWDEVVREDPDVVTFMPCGYDLAETRQNLHYCTERPEWRDLTAVCDGNVFLFDGSSYFNRPGPRLYRSIELMGTALHPDRISVLEPPVGEWELQHVPRSSSTSAA